MPLFEPQCSIREANAIAARNLRRAARAKRYHEYRQSCEAAAVVLSGDERLRSVRAKRDALSFETEWIESIEIIGERVFIGRFRSVLAPNDEEVAVKWIEFGAKENQRQHYVLTERFCFGDRFPYLEALLEMGEYLALVYAILDSLAYINPEHQVDALANYQRVPKKPLVVSTNDTNQEHPRCTTQRSLLDFFR
jgi:hypothetical protein